LNSVKETANMLTKKATVLNTLYTIREKDKIYTKMINMRDRSLEGIRLECQNLSMQDKISQTITITF